MFTPSRAEARRFFFDAWSRYRAGAALSDLERTAVGVIAAHPEYHAVLDSPDRHVERDWLPEQGETNPFLHLSMHLALAEQLAIDQPAGIRAEYRRLLAAHDEHDALHAIIDCLGEVIWQSQRTGQPPSGEDYLECVRSVR